MPVNLSNGRARLNATDRPYAAGAADMVRHWEWSTEKRGLTVARTFGEVLCELRDRAAMTQEALAERSGVGVRSIRGYERGERTNPQVFTVKQLADALPLSDDERKAFFALAVGREPGWFS